MAGQSNKGGAKHHLLVYRWTGKRYRPAAILLIIMGIIALLPTFVPIMPKNAFLTAGQLATIGIASLILGLVLFVVSIMIVRNAYVQCLPDFLLVNTMLHRVYVSYQRINTYQPVQVAKVFDIKLDKKTAGKNALSDREKEIIKPYLPDTALEVQLREFPVDEQKLRKAFSRFLFSTRSTGFIFIIPKPPALSIELSTYTQRALDKRDEDQQRYQDPIERLKYQNTKTF